MSLGTSTRASDWECDDAGNAKFGHPNDLPGYGPAAGSLCRLNSGELMTWLRGACALAVCFLAGCTTELDRASTATVGLATARPLVETAASTTGQRTGNAVAIAAAVVVTTNPVPQPASPATVAAFLAPPTSTLAPTTAPVSLYDLSSVPSCSISVTLRLGDAGADVLCLQTRMGEIATGGEVVIDGTFGTNTDNLVRLFQAVHSLTVDGVVGPQTAGLLNIWVDAPPPTLPPTTARPEIQPVIAPVADAYYENCDAARAAGAAPIHRGEPGYRSQLDRDDDGVACE